MIMINAYDDVCQTIKANYYKVSLCNFIRGGQTFAAPGIIECEKDGRISQKEIEEFLNEREQRNNSGR